MTGLLPFPQRCSVGHVERSSLYIKPLAAHLRCGDFNSIQRNASYGPEDVAYLYNITVEQAAEYLDSHPHTKKLANSLRIFGRDLSDDQPTTAEKTIEGTPKIGDLRRCASLGIHDISPTSFYGAETVAALLDVDETEAEVFLAGLPQKRTIGGNLRVLGKLLLKALGASGHGYNLTTIPDSTHLTVSEAAQILGLSSQKFRKLYADRLIWVEDRHSRRTFTAAALREVVESSTDSKHMKQMPGQFHNLEARNKNVYQANRRSQSARVSAMFG
jgi:hypothetical protein